MVLSTANKEGAPQSSVMMYASDGYDIYIPTGKDTLKARNIQGNRKVGVVVPFYKNLLHRLIKAAPPAEIHFRGEAEILPGDDKKARDMLNFEPPEGFEASAIYLKIKPISKIACYGVGISFLKMRDIKAAGKVVELKPD